MAEDLDAATRSICGDGIEQALIDDVSADRSDFAESPQVLTDHSDADGAIDRAVVGHSAKSGRCSHLDALSCALIGARNIPVVEDRARDGRPYSRATIAVEYNAD